MAGLAAAIALAGCGPSAPPGAESGLPGDEPGPGVGAPVVLDGLLDEWEGIPPLVEDDADPVATPVIDLESLSVVDDPAWLFLQLDVGEPLNLQAMPGTILVLVDADGDPGTGQRMEGMSGVEFAVELSSRPDPARSSHGAGFALRLPDGSTRTPYDVGLAGLPTFAAEGFELRLSRNPRGGLPPLGSTVRLGMVARADATDGPAASGAPAETVEVDRLPATPYRLSTAPGPDPFEPEFERLAPPEEGAFRLLAWNVGSETFRDADAFASVLGLIRPDVVLLDEVYGDVSAEELEAFFELPPLDSLGEWSFVVSRGGGRQKTVVAARDRAVRQEPTMEEVAYAPGELEELGRSTPPSFQPALEYEARMNLSATGAWVEVDPERSPGREVLFVPVDLQSAGWRGSPQDGLRLLQARTLLRHLRRAVLPGDSLHPAVVVAGDLNLVGGREPLDVLLDDEGGAFGPLVPASLPRLDEATWATWLSERQAMFGPGRLDFALYSRGTLEQVGGFVFGSVGLTDQELASVGTDRQAVVQLEEDHLPMIVDLRLRGPSSR